MEPTLYYGRKAELYAHIASEPRDGPPEAKWYGLWCHVLHSIAYTDASLLVFPQLDFRVRTANPFNKINQSTRYTDIALVDSLPLAYDDNNNFSIVKTKLLIAMEVKPPSIDARDNAQNEVIEQAQHYLMMEPERESAVTLILISAVGKSWSWANVQRTPTTPAAESNRGATRYIKERKGVVSVIPRPNANAGDVSWSMYHKIGTLESDREMAAVVKLMVERRLYL